MVVSLFLLSFVALGVLSMTRMAFVAQRRNEHILEATQIAQSTLNQVRAWALQPDHYLGNWSVYDGVAVASPLPEYSVHVRCRAQGVALDSPCSALEAQWQGTPQGIRRLPRALVPVQVQVAWSANPADQVRLLAYMGEPKRDLTGIQVLTSGPQPNAISQSQDSLYTVAVRDAQGRNFDNLLFRWSVDDRYLSVTAQRDGRRCVMLRDKSVVAPVPPAPTVLPVQCYATYAGASIPIVPAGLGMP